MMASSSAITTRVGTGWVPFCWPSEPAAYCEGSVRSSVARGGEPVEEVVLGPLHLLDGGTDGIAVAGHGLGVARCGAMFLLGQRRLRHQGPQTSLVGVVGQAAALIVADGELRSGLPQPFGQLGQPLFDQRS